MFFLLLNIYFIFILTQRCEHHEAHEPSDLLTHGVAGGGVAYVAGLEHGKGPAVHRHVLGGGQEVQDEVESRQRGHVKDTRTLIMTKYIHLTLLEEYVFLNSPRQCQVAHHRSG